MQDQNSQIDAITDAIPDDAWPMIELLFNLTMLTTAVWLAWTLFVMIRRSKSNLTPVNSTSQNRRAEPDFLSVDEDVRKEAIKQGEAFGKELDKRDAADEAAKLRASRQKESMWQRISRLISLLMALFSIGTMITGTIWQVTIMGRYWSELSAGDRLIGIIQKYPLGVAIALFVIAYNIVTTVNKLNKKDA